MADIDIIEDLANGDIPEDVAESSTDFSAEVSETNAEIREQSEEITTEEIKQKFEKLRNSSNKGVQTLVDDAAAKGMNTEEFNNMIDAIYDSYTSGNLSTGLSSMLKAAEAVPRNTLEAIQNLAKAIGEGTAKTLKKVATSLDGKEAGEVFDDAVNKHNTRIKNLSDAIDEYKKSIGEDGKPSEAASKKLDQAMEDVRKSGDEFSKTLDDTMSKTKTKIEAEEGGSNRWERLKSFMKWTAVLGSIGGLLAFMFLTAQAQTGCFVYVNGNKQKLDPTMNGCGKFYGNYPENCRCGINIANKDKFFVVADNTNPLPQGAATLSSIGNLGSTPASAGLKNTNFKDCKNNADVCSCGAWPIFSSKDASYTVGHDNLLCSTSPAGPGGVFYAYQLVTPLDAIAQLPGDIAKLITLPVQGIGNILLTIGKWVGITFLIIIGLSILWAVVKFVISKVKQSKTK
jgi:hypothetical protein